MTYNPKYNKRYFLDRKSKIIQERKEKRAQTRKKLLYVLGGKCKNCGFLDERALQIDHINGGGTKENKTINGAFRSKYFLDKAEQDIVKFLSKYQLLCANCNWIKRHTNDELKINN